MFVASSPFEALLSDESKELDFYPAEHERRKFASNQRNPEYTLIEWRAPITSTRIRMNFRRISLNQSQEF